MLFVPLHAPDAAQVSAFVELQVRTLELPAAIDMGEALRVTVGAGALLELLELDAPDPPLAPVPPALTLPPPPPPPQALNAKSVKNKTGRRFIENLLYENIKTQTGPGELARRFFRTCHNNKSNLAGKKLPLKLKFKRSPSETSTRHAVIRDQA